VLQNRVLFPRLRSSNQIKYPPLLSARNQPLRRNQPLPRNQQLPFNQQLPRSHPSLLLPVRLGKGKHQLEPQLKFRLIHPQLSSSRPVIQPPPRPFQPPIPTHTVTISLKVARASEDQGNLLHPPREKLNLLDLCPNHPQISGSQLVIQPSPRPLQPSTVEPILTLTLTLAVVAVLA
jgi:hypothetical protein